jgi:hypothetical protein
MVHLFKSDKWIPDTLRIDHLHKIEDMEGRLVDDGWTKEEINSQDDNRTFIKQSKER